jgi:hypothetical protein
MKPRRQIDGPMSKTYSWLIAICLCLIILSTTTTVRAISESQAHKLYNEGLALYKSGLQPENIKYLKQALRNNIQGLDYVFKLVNRYIAAHPHEKYVLEIRSLLIQLLKLESRFNQNQMIPAAKGQTAIIKGISVFCSPVTSPTQMFYWNWCVF